MQRCAKHVIITHVFKHTELCPTCPRSRPWAHSLSPCATASLMMVPDARLDGRVRWFENWNLPTRQDRFKGNYLTLWNCQPNKWHQPHLFVSCKAASISHASLMRQWDQSCRFRAFQGQVAATGEDGWQYLWEAKSSGNLQGNRVIPPEDLKSYYNRVCNECPPCKHHYKNLQIQDASNLWLEGFFNLSMNFNDFHVWDPPPNFPVDAFDLRPQGAHLHRWWLLWKEKRCPTSAQRASAHRNIQPNHLNMTPGWCFEVSETHLDPEFSMEVSSGFGPWNWQRNDWRNQQTGRTLSYKV